MSYTEKYTISKRGHEEGPYTTVEIIDLLRMKELSLIHKVKIAQDWVTVADFVDKHEKGELPEQNVEKAFEEVEKEAAEKKEEGEEEKKPEPEPEPEPIEVPEPGPAVEIRVNRSGQEFGPYLIKEVKDYLKAGNLRFSDMIWFQGLPDWVPLSSIPGVSEGIESLGAAAPPPPKPPPAPVAAPPSPPAAGSPPGTAAKPAGEKEEREFEPLRTVEGDEDPDTAGLAGHGPRSLAALIDWAILGAVLGAVIGITFGPGGEVAAWMKVVAVIVVHLLFGWIYFALTESSKALGTVGHRVAKIQVVTAEGSHRIGFGRATGRALLKSLFALSVILPFIVFVSRRRQGLHDLACGTLVRIKPAEDVFEAPADEDEEDAEE